MTKHGDYVGNKKTTLYRIWDNMHSRCYRKSYAGYHRYGGRGITVCDEWLHNYVAFKTWAMKHGYRDGLQIDRIDNNKGYSPDNCRFVTVSQQNRNRRDNIIIEFGGFRGPLIAFAELFDVPYYTAYSRYRKGWPIVRVLSSVPLPSPKQPKSGRVA